MSETQAAIDQSVSDLIQEIGLPNDFLSRLANDDDWAFVIKLHALIEAAMTHALVVSVGKDETRELFAYLELCNNKTGKLAFSKVFLELESEDRRFIRSFSELRNSLVHDVRKVAFQLQVYFASLTLERRRAFVRDFGYADYSDDESASALDRAIARATSDLRQPILRSTLFLVAVLQFQLSTHRHRREAIAHTLRFAELVHKHNAALAPDV